MVLIALTLFCVLERNAGPEIWQTRMPDVYATVRTCLFCMLKLRRYKARMTIQQQEKCKLFDPVCRDRNRAAPITANASVVDRLMLITKEINHEQGQL
ncbi:MAG: hypothetical protein HZB64_01115 [Rhodocyclales bacterium]|nr:hypothetical protein [Rhodocyclales bacterium]